MAVFPDRIVLKNSTDDQATIEAAIQTGGTDEITQGEIVLGINPASVQFYTKAGDGSIVTLGGTSVSTLGDLTDVDLSTPATDGQVIAYNATSGNWEPVDQSGGGGSVSLNDLTDVSYVSGSLEPTALDQIVFSSADVPSGETYKIFANSTYGMSLGAYDANGGSYLYVHKTKGLDFKVSDSGVFNFSGPISETDNAPEIRLNTGNPTAVTPTGNYFGLKLPAGYSADQTYVVPAVDGTNGQVLTTDGAGVLSWTSAAGSGGSSTLAGLDDTTIDNPAAGDILQYTSSTATPTEAAIFPYDTGYLDSGGLEGGPITTVATGGTTIDSAEKKYGSASLLVDTNAGSGVVYANTPAFDIGAEFTIEAWLYLDNPVSTNTDAFHIVSKMGSGTADQHAYSWSYLPPGFTSTGPSTFRFSVGTTTGFSNVYSVSYTFPAQQWVHVAVTRDSSGNINFWVDGVLNRSFLGGIPDTTTANLRVGNWRGTESAPSDWRIDDLAISKYNKYTAPFTPPGPLKAGNEWINLGAGATDGQVLKYAATQGAWLPSDLAISEADVLRQTPTVTGTSIGSDSTAATSKVITAPTYNEGDILVACIMTRASGGTLTPPSGFTLHGTYLSSIAFSGDTQYINVFTRIATASEPATYTWTQASSARICGFIAAVSGNAVIDSVLENYGNAETATITTATNFLNLTAATWVYAVTGSPETYSQTGAGVTEITDSPTTNARISGGYTTEAGTVTSTHTSSTASNSPNHGMICIRMAVPTTISDFDDVDTVTTPPTDGQALTWVAANNQWEPSSLQGTAVRMALGIGEYVDDAAAGTGGVASGAMYYNTTSSDYRLKT